MIKTVLLTFVFTFSAIFCGLMPTASGASANQTTVLSYSATPTPTPTVAMGKKRNEPCMMGELQAKPNASPPNSHNSKRLVPPPNPGASLMDLENVLRTTDQDCDGVSDYFDNCALVYNPSQKDRNKNGVGDGCERSTPKSNTKKLRPTPKT